MKSINNLSNRLAGVVSLTTLLASGALAQLKLPGDSKDPVDSAGIWPYVTISVVLISLGVAYYFWKQSKKSIEGSASGGDRNEIAHLGNNSFEVNDVDADKELEWLRKSKKKGTSKDQKVTFGLKRSEKVGRSADDKNKNSNSEIEGDTKAFQERMRMLQYAQLPINSFGDLLPPKQPDLLLDSNAKALLEAIDQANQDIEPDESVRDVSIKVLAAFRTSNSVDALSQMALYDLSANLRSKAVTILADFDHESVFETILLACADPTREVRAAAARALFRLNFDRSGAWRRIMETRDEYRMNQAVRAAIEAGIAVRSFDRLVHEDPKVAYEAFALVALMIKAGETNEIFEAIRVNKDERVKLALLHVLRAMKDERSLKGLSELLQSGRCSNAVVERVESVIDSFTATAKSAV